MTKAHILAIIFCVSSILIGCNSEKLGPGISFAPPSPSTIMLPPPTAAQQVTQPKKTNTCGPAVAITLHRVIVGRNYDWNQAVREIMRSPEGTYHQDFINWMVGHGMETSMTTVPTTSANNMIAGAIKAGYYVVPTVNEDAKPNSPHFFIVYGVDGGRILVSDSNRHWGQNRIAIDAGIFQRQWLVNLVSNGQHVTPLIFVNSKPKK